MLVRRIHGIWWQGPHIVWTVDKATRICIIVSICCLVCGWRHREYVHRRAPPVMRRIGEAEYVLNPENETLVKSKLLIRDLDPPHWWIYWRFCILKEKEEMQRTLLKFGKVGWEIIGGLTVVANGCPGSMIFSTKTWMILVGMSTSGFGGVPTSSSVSPKDKRNWSVTWPQRLYIRILDNRNEDRYFSAETIVFMD